MCEKIIYSIILSTSASMGLLAQNVGIGTTNPNRAKFEVYGAVGNNSAIFGGNGVGVSFGLNAPGIGFNSYYNGNNLYINNGTAMVQWQNHLTGSMYLDATTTVGTPNAVINGLQRVMTIKWNGDMALENGEANTSLFVGSGFGVRGARLQGTTYHTEFNKTGATRISGGKSGSDVYINDVSSGHVTFGGFFTNVGINKVPSRTLDIKQVNGRGFVLVEPTTFHNWEFVTTKNLTDPASDYYVYYNGQYKGNFFYVDGGYYPISDGRLKKDVQTLNSSIDKILRLNPVRYSMKRDVSKTKQFGFLAQEVRAIFPELVEVIREKDSGYDMNEFLTMNYNGLSPIVISAMQEQQQQITHLQSRIDNLKQKIAALRKLTEKK